MNRLVDGRICKLSKGKLYRTGSHLFYLTLYTQGLLNAYAKEVLIKYILSLFGYLSMQVSRAVFRHLAESKEWTERVLAAIGNVDIKHSILYTT